MLNLFFFSFYSCLLDPAIKRFYPGITLVNSSHLLLPSPNENINVKEKTNLLYVMPG